MYIFTRNSTVSTIVYMFHVYPVAMIYLRHSSQFSEADDPIPRGSHGRSSHHGQAGAMTGGVTTEAFRVRRATHGDHPFFRGFSHGNNSKSLIVIYL